MKINKIRAAGIGCLAAMTGLVTAASLVLTAPADAAKAHSHDAPAAAASPTASGTAHADDSSVASGNATAIDGSVASGDAVAIHGSVASGCSTAIDDSTASGGNCGPAHAAPTAGPAKAVAGNPSFAG